MPIQSAQDLLVHELHDIQDAEQQAGKVLQKMSDQAEDEELKQMLQRRIEEGKGILEAVEQSLKQLNGKSRGENAAARALIKSAEELASDAQTPEMKRAVMIAGAQKLEHYCIAAWGTVKALAGELGAEDLAKAMERAVEEGYQWDEEMSDLAESRVNPEALEAYTSTGKR